MNIITQKDKRYLPHNLKTRENVVKLIEYMGILVMFAESIRFIDNLYGDGIKNMMALKKV